MNAVECMVYPRFHHRNKENRLTFQVNLFSLFFLSNFEIKFILSIAHYCINDYWIQLQYHLGSPIENPGNKKASGII